MTLKITRSSDLTPRLKVLYYGPPKSGKTLNALSFPRPLLVDSEGGADLYAQRGDVAPFAVYKTARFTDLVQAVDHVIADDGKSYDTLILDSLTVFVDVLRADRAGDKGTLGYRERAAVNVLMGGLYAKLALLPVHLVVIAHEGSEYATDGNNLKRTGDKAQADSSINYRFDYVLQTRRDFSALVVESRGFPAKGEVLKAAGWAALEPATRADDLRNLTVARAFFDHWKARGLSEADILGGLKVAKLSQWTDGRAAADGVLAALVK